MTRIFLNEDETKKMIAAVVDAGEIEVYGYNAKHILTLKSNRFKPATQLKDTENSEGYRLSAKLSSWAKRSL